MTDTLPFKTPVLPKYAVDLLEAAKNLLTADAGRADELLRELEQAVIAFEKGMPVDVSGCIRERSA